MYNISAKRYMPYFFHSGQETKLRIQLCFQLVGITGTKAKTGRGEASRTSPAKEAAAAREGAKAEAAEGGGEETC